MKNAYFILEEEEKKYIIELYNTCKKVDLGNVSFQYFFTPQRPFEVFFYLNEYATYWGLVVKHKNYTDMYKISDDGLIEYDYSEAD